MCHCLNKLNFYLRSTESLYDCLRCISYNNISILGYNDKGYHQFDNLTFRPERTFKKKTTLITPVMIAIWNICFCLQDTYDCYEHVRTLYRHK